MNSVVNSINEVLSWLMDLIYGPISVLSRSGQLIFISLVAGVFLLLMYGQVSSQSRLKDVKTKIFAAFLEAILFRHDGMLTFRAQGRMLKLSLVYFSYALPAILVLAIPCVLLLGQLNMRYGYDPLKPGETVQVTAKLRTKESLKDLSLSSGDNNIEVLLPPVRVAFENTSTWRVVSLGVGKTVLSLSVPEKALLAEEVISGNNDDRGHVIVNGRVSDWWLSLLYPGKEILNLDSPVREFWIQYPDAYYQIFGMEWHWLVVFFVFSLISGLLASRVFRVEI